jgi:3',5'-cyclic AMP phosphodiesterase CpdA
VRARDFFNKRVTGSATLLLRRSTAHQTSVVEAAVRDIEQQSVDHVVVTGDLTNLSLQSEFDAVTGILRKIGGRERLSVVPGNHDVYTRSSRGLFEQACAEWLPDDHGERGFPWVKHVGDDVVIIGLTTAIPTPWFFANGRVGKDQRDRLEAILEDPEIKGSGKFVIVLLHHPLANEPHHRLYFMRSLKDAGALLDVLKRGGVSMVLHGHNHIRYSANLDGIPVHTAASTSNVGASGPGSRAWARYVVWDIDPGTQTASAVHTRVYDPDSTRFVEAPSTA